MCWTKVFKEIRDEEWITFTLQSKSKSKLMMFSKNTYAIYKCALQSRKMIRLLVKFYNTLIRAGYYIAR